MDFKLLPYQYDFVNSEHTITMMLCARAVGKTYAGASLILKKLLENKNGLIISPTFQNIKQNIMTQLINIFDEVGLKEGKHYKYNSSTCTVIMSNGAKIYSRSAEKPNSPRGLTDINFLYADEAAFFDEEIYSVGLLTLRGKNVKHPQIYITTSPGSTANWTSKIAFNPTVKLITATIFDNKYTSQASKDLAIRASEDKPYAWQRREIYGEIVDYDENSMFNDNDWKTLTTNNIHKDGKIVVGIDVAGGGDYTSITAIRGNKIIFIEKALTPELDDLLTFVKLHCAKINPDKIRVDSGGIGHFLPNELNKIFDNVEGVNFGSHGKDPYFNKRAEIYADIKTRIREGLHFDSSINEKYIEEVREEMFSTSNIDKNGLIGIVEKSKIKQKIGRSPDILDSVALACYDINAEINNNERIERLNLIAESSNPFKKTVKWR